MPKTAVHKDCEPQLPENKIGFAKDFLIPPPAGDLVSAKQFCQRNFRVFVPTTADRRHTRRALISCKEVRHPLALLDQITKAQFAISMHAHCFLHLQKEIRNVIPVLL